MSIECNNNITIPLRLEGTKTMFVTRSPTEEELNNCIHIDLTSKREWEPATVNLQIQSTSSNVTADWNVKCSISTISNSPVTGDRYTYNDIHKDESILHDIEPSYFSYVSQFVQVYQFVQ
jgi:hypothetical protein